METSNRLDTVKSGQPFFKGLIRVLVGAALVSLLMVVVFVAVTLASSPAGSGIKNVVVWLLAGDKPQVTWYITRAAGFTSYLLLWLSTAWGLAVPSRILDGILQGSWTFEFHQFISLLSIAFLGLHMGILMADQYMPYSLAQIFFPFISNYRPGWVGVGVLAMYIILLVTITFYIRSRISMKTFRAIHVLSLLGFLGGAAHSFGAGTDSPLPVVQVMYAVTILSVVFLTTYWLVGLAMKKRKAAVAAPHIGLAKASPAPAQARISPTERQSPARRG